MKYRLGVCLPTALKNPDIPVKLWLNMVGRWSRENWNAGNGIVEAESLENLDTDDNKNVFFDRKKR